MCVITRTIHAYIALVESVTQAFLFPIPKELLSLFTYTKLQDQSKQLQRLLFTSSKLFALQSDLKVGIFQF